MCSLHVFKISLKDQLALSQYDILGNSAICCSQPGTAIIGDPHTHPIPSPFMFTMENLNIN